MGLDSILVPLDGSVLADRILGPVRRLLHSSDASVVLLTIASEAEVPGSRDPEQVAIARVRAHVERIRDELEAQGAHAVVRVGVGKPAEEILEHARALNPSLLALATHGRTGLDRFARGSTAEHILRSSPFPVLLVNPTVPANESGPFQRILVPIDGSDLAAEALPLARDLARRDGSEVVLFHAVDVGVYLDPVPAVSPAETETDVARLFARLRGRLEGVRVCERSALGAPARAILDAARRERVDLIALTTHGRSGVSRWVYGSVAEQVVRQAPCPILVHRSARPVPVTLGAPRLAG